MTEDSDPMLQARLAAIEALNTRLNRFAIILRMAASVPFVDDESLSAGCRDNPGINAIMQTQFRYALDEARAFAVLLESGLKRPEASAA